LIEGLSADDRGETERAEPYQELSAPSAPKLSLS
jgi:hypothetical protein